MKDRSDYDESGIRSLLQLMSYISNNSIVNS